MSAEVCGGGAVEEDPYLGNAGRLSLHLMEAPGASGMVKELVN